MVVPEVPAQPSASASKVLGRKCSTAGTWGTWHAPEASASGVPAPWGPKLGLRSLMERLDMRQARFMSLRS